MSFWVISVMFVIGVLLIFLFDISSKFITKLFPIVTGKTRIIFNYITVLTIICVYIVYLYTFHPFAETTSLYGFFHVSPLSGTFFALSSLVLTIGCFIFLSEVDTFSKTSKITYSSLLFVQYSVFIMVAANSWLFVYSGLLGIVIGISFISRNFSLKKGKREQEDLHTLFVFDILTVSLLFIGILFYNLSFGTFSFSHDWFSSYRITEVLSFVFTLCAGLILIKIPPFHFRNFAEINTKIKSLSVLKLFKKIIGIFIIFVLVSSFRFYSFYNQFYFVIMIALGIIVSLWGTIGSIKKMVILELLAYIDFYYIGTMLIFLSYILNSATVMSSIIENYAITLFLFIYYILGQVTQISMLNLLSSRYKIETLEDFQRGKRLEITELSPFAFLQFAQISFPFSLAYVYVLFLNFQDLKEPYFIVILVVSSINLFLGIISSFRVIQYSLRKNTSFLHQEKIEPNLYISTILSLFILLFYIVFVRDIIAVCYKSFFLFFS